MGTINCQNLNSLNITTENLSTQSFSANNATINDLNVSNSLNVPILESATIKTNVIETLSSGNIILNNYTLGSDISLTSSLISPEIRTNNITTTTGSGIISVDNSTVFDQDVTCNNLISPNANLDTITGTNLTYINGSIDQLSGGNVQYGTGNIGDINGNNLVYSTGDIQTLSTKELTITSAILSCPNANIDTLTVNNTFTSPLIEAPDIHVDFVRSYSLGKTTFQENVVVDTQFNCPLVSTDVIQTNGSGNIILNNNVLGSDISLTSLLSSPSVRTNTVNTTTGTGNINISRPFVLPNIRPSSALSYYGTASGTLNTSGCITTTLNYHVVRVGNAITIFIECFPNTTLATASSVLFISGLPGQYAPNIASVRGICLVNGALGVVAGSYHFQSSGQLNVFSGTGGGGFPIGNPCGLAGSAGDFAVFNLITNN